MTDDKAPPTPAIPPPAAADFIARYQEFETKAAELHSSNKTLLLTALKDFGVAKIIVRFDGYGDSGQIEEVTAFGVDDQECALPAGQVELQKVQFGGDEPFSHRASLAEGVETLAYAFLASAHGGWENNEGAFGEFLFDVSAGTVTLDYNERYEASENFSHEF